jgi:hypothetical protein
MMANTNEAADTYVVKQCMKQAASLELLAGPEEEASNVNSFLRIPFVLLTFSSLQRTVSDHRG